MSGAKKTGMGVRRLLGLAMVLAVMALAWTGRGMAQDTGTGQSPNRPTHVTPQDMDDPLSGGIGNPVMQERRLRQLNAALHKQMVSDTQRLVKLVTELNEEIDRTGPASLTPDELRKVAEIEKLAHGVKDKMRTTVQGTPGFGDDGPAVPFPPRTH